MEKIIEKMQEIGFSKMESMVYITLLKYPDQNGYQLSKILKLTKSTVYNCLENLYKKGAVYLISGESSSYKAKEPDILFDTLKDKYIKNTSEIKEELRKISTYTENTQYFNLAGYSKCMQQIKEIIAAAKKEICMNIGMDISTIKEDIKNAAERGVRVIIYSFRKIELESENIEKYENIKFGRKEGNSVNIIVVSDLEKGVIASGDKNQEFAGTYSENRFFISTISTNIHFDIYLFKLENEYKKNLITEKIMLNSLSENKFKEILKSQEEEL